MRKCIRVCVVVLGLVSAMAASTGHLIGAEPTATTNPSGVLILDTQVSFWRVHYTFSPPLVREGTQLSKLPTDTGQTALPPKDWAQVDFDDSYWPRIAGRPLPPDLSPAASKESANAGITGVEGSSPALGLMCIRGKFGVTDPAAVKDLNLFLSYRGGAVVYLNGQEIGRANMPKDAAAIDSPAEDYPKEAFLKPDGSPVMQVDSTYRPAAPATYASWKARVRSTQIAIPAKALRKGTNVLAVEVHRAPYVPEVKAWIQAKKITWEISSFLWSTCSLHNITLESPSAEGLSPNVARPKGLQVWNSQPMQQDFDLDYGDAQEPLRPIRLVGSRGGFFSGKVVVGSDQAIQGLTAQLSELTDGKGGKIPAGAVQVRYALPTAPRFAESVMMKHYPVPAVMFDGLGEVPPASVEVRSAPGGKWSFGAVCPVWVSVAIPPQAKPGNYTAQLTISAQGAQSVQAPVELKVCNWQVPKPSEFHTVVDMIQSPESVAMQYDVPIYSDKHFKLLEKSLDRMGHVGNWTVHIPLICQTNLGNEQSMVRWIKKADGTYKFDFTVMDRYLDLATEHMGKPRIVMLVVWDIFLGAINVQYPGKDKIADDEVPVSMLDEATGQVTMGTVGRHDQSTKATWKALMGELMEHLRKRGLDKAAILGFAYDVCPSDEKAAFWSEVMPGVGWGRYGHFDYPTFGGKVPVKIDFVSYCGCGSAGMWSMTSQYGWKNPTMVTSFVRLGSESGAFLTGRDPWINIPLNLSRLLGELNIQGPRRGFGRIGLDYWPVLKNARGQQVVTIEGRFPRSTWRQIDMMVLSFVPPGPEGALSTAKLEMMREGLQEAEARIFIESVLTDPARVKRLPAPLAGKAQAVLDERMAAFKPVLERQTTAGFESNKPLLDGLGFNGLYAPMFSAMFQQWYLSSGWQDRSEKLFSVAAEVAEAVK